jgi:hypothetical protein
MNSYCCKLECLQVPNCQVDGMACQKCRSYSYCRCNCKSLVAPTKKTITINSSLTYYEHVRKDGTVYLELGKFGISSDLYCDLHNAISNVHKKDAENEVVKIVETILSKSCK